MDREWSREWGRGSFRAMWQVVPALKSALLGSGSRWPQTSETGAWEVAEQAPDSLAKASDGPAQREEGSREEYWLPQHTFNTAQHAFELWCWRRLSRVPWTARRSNQSILKEINPGISLEGMMLKLKLRYFGHVMWSVDSLDKSLMLGGIWGRRRKGRQRMRWLDGITDSMEWVSVNSGR